MGKLIGLAFVVVFVIFGISLCGAGVGYNNQWVTAENGIKAQYSENQNKYDNRIKAILEASQVPESYKDDLKEVVTAANTSRYGADGSKAVFNFLVEKNPELSPTLYSKIQQLIETGRADFENEQKLLIDKKQVYETSLQQFPASIFAGFLGFPKIDLNQYGIVTSTATEKAFATKKDEPLDLRRHPDAGAK